MRNIRDLAKFFRGYGECRARRVRNNIPGSQRDGGLLLLKTEERIDEQDQTKKVLVWCGRDGESRVKFLQLLLVFPLSCG